MSLASAGGLRGRRTAGFERGHESTGTPSSVRNPDSGQEAPCSNSETLTRIPSVDLIPRSRHACGRPVTDGFRKEQGRSMTTRRRFPRFRSQVPVKITSRAGDVCQLIPDDIGAAGCYFSCRGEELSSIEGINSVEIPLGAGRSITCRRVRVVEPPRGPSKHRHRLGLALHWEVDPDDQTLLQDHLRRNDRGAGTWHRIAFVVAEQKALNAQILALDEGRQKRWQVLLTLVLVYVAFLAAPTRVNLNPSAAALFFYAVAGVWGSIALLVHADRLLEYLGYHTRERTYLQCAINCNRGYVVGDDPQFYANTVFPMTVLYDKSRAWSQVTDTDKFYDIEMYPQRTRRSLYPVWYIVFLQILFLGGLYYYLGILLGYQDQHMNTGTLNPLDTFNLGATVAAASVGATFCLVWIQFIGNCCLHYHRALWEANRISPARPNPRATGAAFERRAEARWIGWVLVLCASFSVVVLVGAIAEGLFKKQPIMRTWLASNAWPYTLGVVVLFLFAKVLETRLSLKWESDIDVHAKPLSLREA